MEEISRFILANWGVFIVLGTILFFVGEIIGGSDKKWIYNLGNSGLILGLVLFSAPIISFVYGGIWWSKNVSSVPMPQANIEINPSTGTFSESEKIDLTLQIENQGELPITELQIGFPFVEGLVFDYLSASHELTYKFQDKNLFTGKTINIYFAKMRIQVGETWQLTIPIQLTDYGNFDGTISIDLSITKDFGVKPIGIFGKDPVVKKTLYSTFAMTLAVVGQTVDKIGGLVASYEA